MEPKNLYIAGLISVLLLTGSIYFYPFPKENTPTALSGMARYGSVGDGEVVDTIITYDGERYEPREVTVEMGARVRFENISDAQMWPASAIHPTHSIYPGKEKSDCLGSAFDACRGLEKGESWSFIFNHAGEWRYHDHVNASKTGVITVQ